MEGRPRRMSGESFAEHKKRMAKHEKEVNKPKIRKTRLTIKQKVLNELDERILGIGERAKGQSKEFKLKSDGAQTSLTVFKMWINENL